MCTVTWLEEDCGYHLFCSRDEHRTRDPAHLPRVFERDGVHWIAPVDAEHGGSWISVNEFGIGLCLLNGGPGNGEVSRGEIVMDHAAYTDRLEIVERVGSADLRCYAPFSLTILEPGVPAILIEWDGRESALFGNANPFLPLASSSLDRMGARRERSGLFRKLRPACVADHLAFHASHLPEPGPYSPCMHRDDAHTVSFSHVEVAAGAVAMTYYPEPLCRNPQPFSLNIHAPHFDCAVHASQ